MKKVLIPVLAAALLLAGPAMARSKYKEMYKVDRHFYLSAGGSYLMERFEIEELSVAADDRGLVLDFDNGFSVLGRLGFRLNDVWSAQGELNWFDKLEWSGRDLLAPATSDSFELEMGTATLCVKLHPPVGAQTLFRPYVLAGGGFMYAKISPTVPAGGKRENGSNEEIDPVFKGGGGLDVFLTDWFAVGVEGTYNVGFHDLNEIQYVNIAGFCSLYF